MDTAFLWSGKISAILNLPTIILDLHRMCAFSWLLVCLGFLCIFPDCWVPLGFFPRAKYTFVQGLHLVEPGLLFSLFTKSWTKFITSAGWNPKPLRAISDKCIYSAVAFSSSWDRKGNESFLALIGTQPLAHRSM